MADTTPQEAALLRFMREARDARILAEAKREAITDAKIAYDAANKKATELERLRDEAFKRYADPTATPLMEPTTEGA